MRTCAQNTTPTSPCNCACMDTRPQQKPRERRCAAPNPPCPQTHERALRLHEAQPRCLRARPRRGPRWVRAGAAHVGAWRRASALGACNCAWTWWPPGLENGAVQPQIRPALKSNAVRTGADSHFAQLPKKTIWLATSARTAKKEKKTHDILHCDLIGFV